MPAVRSVGGNCVDEKGCDAEEAIACAFDACGTNLTGSTNACSVSFLKCADETPWTTAEKLVSACSAAAGVDAAAVTACLGDAAKTTALLAEASKLFNAQYPGSTFIPAVAIADAPLTSPSYDSVVKAACAAGSKAAVCAEEPGRACLA